MPRGPRALIFDFDGVIADDEPLHLAAFQEALAAEGITLSREAYYARYLGFDDHAAVVEALRAAGRHALPGGHQLVSRGGARRGRPDRELAGGGRMGPARGAVLGSRPETRLGSESESERVPFWGSCERRAAAGKAGAAKLKTLGAVCVRRTVDTSSPATRSRSGKSAAPASPAAARRRPCPPGGTLAVRPRPETESRVGLLVLHLLQDQARRLGHHLLHDPAHRLLGR